MEVIVETEIDAPAALVWRVVAHDFAAIADWFDDVESSRVAEEWEFAAVEHAPGAPVPARVTVSRVVQATEVITAYAEVDRRFTFVALGLPRLVVRSAQSTTAVTELGSARCALHMYLEMDLSLPFSPVGFILKGRLTAMYTRLGSALKAHMESVDDRIGGPQDAARRVRTLLNA